MVSTPPLKDAFYFGLFAEACKAYSNVADRALSEGLVLNALGTRTREDGLPFESAAYLLRLLQLPPDHSLRAKVLCASATLRRELFGDGVATMVPIEVTSFCASNCVFCGWKSENKSVPRFAMTTEGVLAQVKHLAGYGFSHFELSGGDHLSFLRDHLAGLVESVRITLDSMGSDARVSICVTPLHESQYRTLAGKGLDTVLNWQETYDEQLYRAQVTGGPKRFGITEDYRLATQGNGFLFRLRCQENAIRAGLQVGLGCMFGLSQDVAAEVLSVISHGKKLIEHYGSIQPLIIGMPVWNPVPTGGDAGAPHSSMEAQFELLAAIYLLSFPDRMAWVFPNCRVSRATQAQAVATAGCFTSTVVRLVPGAYLPASGGRNGVTIDMRANYSVSTEPLSSQVSLDRLLLGEQFCHHYSEHQDYLDAFSSHGIRPVSERLFFDAKAPQGESRG